MANIKLFSLSDEVTEVKSTSVTLEKELQNIIENNMNTFFGVSFVKSEYIIPEGRMDSIGIDENNCPVIFEYKRSTNENVINQGLYYLEWLLDHKGDFYRLVQKTLGTDAADSIDWSTPSVMCIAADFTKYDLHAVNVINNNAKLLVKLVRYRKYSDSHLLFEFLNSPGTTTNKSNIQIPKTPQPLDSFEDKYNKAPIEMKNLCDSIRDYILSLGDDISENQVKMYVAFKKVKNVACVEIYKSHIFLHLRLEPQTVNISDGFIDEVTSTATFTGLPIRIRIKTPEDFYNVKPLIDRAYNEN
jgi:predicted transport protein